VVLYFPFLHFATFVLFWSSFFWSSIFSPFCFIFLCVTDDPYIICYAWVVEATKSLRRNAHRAWCEACKARSGGGIFGEGSQPSPHNLGAWGSSVSPLSGVQIGTLATNVSVLLCHFLYFTVVRSAYVHLNLKLCFLLYEATMDTFRQKIDKKQTANRIAVCDHPQSAFICYVLKGVLLCRLLSVSTTATSQLYTAKQK